MKNPILLPLVICCTIILTTSCVKLQNKVIMKGEWELVNYRLDTVQTNFMEVILHSYNDPVGCCRYMIDFQDDDKVKGYYYVHDSLNYSVEGTWSLDEKNELYINLDNYVDGLFVIDRQSRTKYQLESDNNTIEFIPGSFLESPTTLDIRRRDK